MTKHSFAVGQNLFFAPSSRFGIECLATIVKVGRKYIETSNGYRFAIDDQDMRADAGQYNSPGRYYLSKEAAESQRALSECWKIFRSLIGARYSIPAGVTANDIKTAAALLGVETATIAKAEIWK